MHLKVSIWTHTGRATTLLALTNSCVPSFVIKIEEEPCFLSGHLPAFLQRPTLKAVSWGLPTSDFPSLPSSLLTFLQPAAARLS